MILKEMIREHLEVFTATKDSRVSYVAELMRANQVGSIVVVDEENSVVGIITDRDIALGLALGAATADSYIGELMTREVETINDSMTLFDVARFFRSVNVKRLPVVDREKRLVGIVSSDDVIAILAREMFDTCQSLETKLGHMV